MTYFDLSKIQVAIETSSALCGDTKIVTIDGPAGSGKTTLANELATGLATAHGAMSVIHLDEIYEGWDGALDAKLFERISAWILTPIRNGLNPRHLKYDWHQGKYTTWSEVPLTSVVIIEGVGSGHASMRQSVSQAIWVEADEDLLLDRVIQRDGASIRDEMLIWEERERTYFDSNVVKSAAHIHLIGQ
jgi:uridine kinase